MKYVDWTTSASTVFSPYLLTLHDRYHNQYFQNICSKFDCMNENSYHSRRFLMKSLSSIMRLWVSLLLLSLIGFKNLHESFEEEGRGFLRIDCTFWYVAINTNYFFSVFDMSGFLFSKSSRPRKSNSCPLSLYGEWIIQLAKQSTLFRNIPQYS